MKVTNKKLYSEIKIKNLVITFPAVQLGVSHKYIEEKEVEYYSTFKLIHKLVVDNTISLVYKRYNLILNDEGPIWYLPKMHKTRLSELKTVEFVIPQSLIDHGGQLEIKNKKSTLDGGFPDRLMYEGKHIKFSRENFQWEIQYSCNSYKPLDEFYP